MRVLHIVYLAKQPKAPLESHARALAARPIQTFK